MAIRIEHVGDVAIVIAEGRFIMEEQVNELETALMRFLDDGSCNNILLDMSAMEFLRSISIGVIATTHANARDRDAKFSLCGMTSRNRSAFELMKFGPELRVFDTREAALKALQEV